VVMGLLLKKLLRDIGEAKGQFASIIMVIIIGVMFYTGFNSTLLNLKVASEQYYADYRLADLWAGFQKAPENVINRISNLPEVKKVTGRVVKDQQITINKHDAVIRLITLPDLRSETVNDVMIRTGRYFSADESRQCLVEEAFFKAQRLRFGDYLEPVINGNKVKLKVIGVVKSPEYLYPLRDGTEMVPDSLRFGVVYVKKSFGQAVFGFNGSVNDVSILLKPGADSSQVQSRLERSLQRYGLIEIIPRKDQLSYNTFAGEIEQIGSISGVFPILFLIVAAIIIYITMTRIIENQRVQIGTMKALGYGNLQIMVHYLSYAALTGLAGSAIGSLIGIWLGKQMIRLYNTIYQLPLEQMQAHYELVIPALLLALIFCGIAGYNSCKKELRLVPAESMRPKAPKTGTRTGMERIGFLWRRFNFSWKIIFRNLFRYKRRVLLTSIGIIFASALLLAALGLNDSIGYLVDQQYSTIQQYDLRVMLKGMTDPAGLNSIRSLPHVSRLEPVVGLGVEISNGWRTKKLGLNGLPEQSRLYRVTDRAGRPVVVPKEGILISNQLSETLGAGPGDWVRIKPLLPGKNREQDCRPARVRGVVSQYVGQSAYGDLNFCGKLLLDGVTANQVLLKLDQLQNQTKVTAKLKEMPTVSSVQSTTDALANLNKALENASFSIGFMILASGILAFAVVYNITTINIFERRRELATLKVLGFTHSEMDGLIRNENLIVTFFSVLCGLFLGSHLLDFLARDASTDNMSLPAVLHQPSYFLAVLLIFAFTLSANFILMKKVHTINMVEALKSSE
jgi:putative ABC transport system permease protein